MEREGLENLDSFAAAPPGIGMTSPKGNFPWERPARHDNSEVAATTVIEKIEGQPQVKEQMLNLMSVGSPIETIVNTVTFMGFVNGEWTPDTAELIKPALMFYFIGAALENNIEATVYNVEPDEENQQSEQDLIRIMKDFRPDEFEMATTELPQSENNVAVMDGMVEEPEQTVPNEGQSIEGFITRKEV